MSNLKTLLKHYNFIINNISNEEECKKTQELLTFLFDKFDKKDLVEEITTSFNSGEKNGLFKALIINSLNELKCSSNLEIKLDNNKYKNLHKFEIPFYLNYLEICIKEKYLNEDNFEKFISENQNIFLFSKNEELFDKYINFYNIVPEKYKNTVLRQFDFNLLTQHFKHLPNFEEIVYFQFCLKELKELKNNKSLRLKYNKQMDNILKYCIYFKNNTFETNCFTQNLIESDFELIKNIKKTNNNLDLNSIYMSYNSNLLNTSYFEKNEQDKFNLLLEEGQLHILNLVKLIINDDLFFINKEKLGNIKTFNYPFLLINYDLEYELENAEVFKIKHNYSKIKNFLNNESITYINLLFKTQSIKIDDDFKVGQCYLNMEDSINHFENKDDKLKNFSILIKNNNLKYILQDEIENSKKNNKRKI